MPRKFTNSKLTEIVVNMFAMNEVMFIYYCGSDNYKTKQKKSDTDLTVVLNNFNGIIHASIEGVDIFAYGYENFLQRQSMHDTLPLYNLIHADDVINMADNLIYLNSSYQTLLYFQPNKTHSYWHLAGTWLDFLSNYANIVTF